MKLTWDITAFKGVRLGENIGITRESHIKCRTVLERSASQYTWWGMIGRAPRSSRVVSLNSRSRVNVIMMIRTSNNLQSSCPIRRLRLDPPRLSDVYTQHWSSKIKQICKILDHTHTHQRDTVLKMKLRESKRLFGSRYYTKLDMRKESMVCVWTMRTRIWLLVLVIRYGLNPDTPTKVTVAWRCPI